MHCNKLWILVCIICLIVSFIWKSYVFTKWDWRFFLLFVLFLKLLLSIDIYQSYNIMIICEVWYTGRATWNSSGPYLIRDQSFYISESWSMYCIYMYIKVFIIFTWFKKMRQINLKLNNILRVSRPAGEKASRQA